MDDVECPDCTRDGNITERDSDGLCFCECSHPDCSVRKFVYAGSIEEYTTSADDIDTSLRTLFQTVSSGETQYNKKVPLNERMDSVEQDLKEFSEDPSVSVRKKANAQRSFEQITREFESLMKTDSSVCFSEPLYIIEREDDSVELQTGSKC